MNGTRAGRRGVQSDGKSVAGVLGLLLFLVAVSGTALSAPSGWVQMTEVNGLGAPPTATTELFTFNGELYSYNEYGLYRMQLTPCLSWEKLTTPTAPGDWTFTPIGTTLFLWKPPSDLYMIAAGTTFSAAAWTSITSQGTPGGADPLPLAVFGGEVYAVHYPTGGSTFEIWRSPHTGLATMAWTRVVSNGFNDPQNYALGFLTVFDGKLIAATTSTRNSMFGDPSGFLQGIEIWASASGTQGTWAQVNVDGFGTQITQVGTSTTFRTNMDVGAHAIYNGALYVGTKSHYGAEVWRYDGTGVSGWVNVTPIWAGPSPLMSTPGRNNDMIVYGGELYLAEGFSTGNLAKMSGGTWSVVIAGPTPFLADNAGIVSLAVLDGRLYASTLHSPYAGTTVGDQVWGTPFAARPPLCVTPRLPDLLYDPPLIRVLVPTGLVELLGTVKNGGVTPIRGEYIIGVYLGRLMIASVDGPSLDQGETAELRILAELPEGEHLLRVIIDPYNAIMEISEENNSITVEAVVPGDTAPEEPDDGPDPASPQVGRVSMGSSSRSVCQPDGTTQIVHVEWQADTTAALQLEIIYPDLRLDLIDLPSSSGDIDVPIILPEGGRVRINLVIPGIEDPLIGTDVILFPC